MADFKVGMCMPYFPPSDLIKSAAAGYEASGADFVFAADQLNVVFPRAIFTPDLIPAVSKGIDLDRWFDPWLVAALAADATNSVEIGILNDWRRPPSSLAQMLLTMDHISKGRLFLCVGAGEVKQFTPYGVARRKPFTHLQEALKIINMLVKRDDLIDYDGPIWRLKDAVMALNPVEESKPPAVLVMGGPGRSIEIAEEAIRDGYADGWATWCPPCGDAEWYAESVQRLRASAVSADRDPDELKFFAMMSCIVYNDSSMHDYFTENLAMRFHAALEMPGAGPTWQRWGGGPNPLGDDYYYARDFIPTAWSREQVLEIAERVPPFMVARSKFTGTPSEVGDLLVPYVEAGCNYLGVGNYGDMLLTGDWGDVGAGVDLVGATVSRVRARIGAGATTSR